jgi:nucleotide-binding universal stress UspA family protein
MTMTTIATAPDEVAPKHRVVVGVDGSPAGGRALEWAAAQAARSGAVLEGHTSYEPGYVFISREEVLIVTQKLISEAAAHVADIAPDVTFKGVTHEGLAAKDLIDASEGADLLVVGSRGLGGFTSLLLGSVSQQCALHAHCPIVIIRPPGSPARTEGRLSQIL